MEEEGKGASQAQPCLLMRRSAHRKLLRLNMTAGMTALQDSEIGATESGSPVSASRQADGMAV